MGVVAEHYQSRDEGPCRRDRAARGERSRKASLSDEIQVFVRDKDVNRSAAEPCRVIDTCGNGMLSEVSQPADERAPRRRFACERRTFGSTSSSSSITADPHIIPFCSTGQLPER